MQTLQDNAWAIIQRAENKRVCVATGQHPRRTSGAFAVTRQASQSVTVGPVCRLDVLPKIILQGTVGGSRRRWTTFSFFRPWYSIPKGIKY